MNTTRLPPARGSQSPPHFRWRVPTNLAYFRGHFPGLPILPGVAEIHDFVLPGVAASFPDLVALRRIQRLKFHRPISPGDEIELFIERENGQPVIRFQIVRGGEPCASGVLIYASGTGAALP